MIHRAMFLTDGPSDQPLAIHLERLCQQSGRAVQVVAPDMTRLSSDRTVLGRLQAVLSIDSEFSLVFVHRDAEKQPPSYRFSEIRRALRESESGLPHVPVVPVRMTEAWLLLDEDAIREVAGNPNGTVALDLPPIRQVERVIDPKETLKQALILAAELSGRRLKIFKRDFSNQRRLLLGRLDIHGSIRQLSAWRRLEADLSTAVSQLPA